ncbi:hypothetical protein NC651_035158 [Populus alba x Populus x berolinensis]|nr:hypothetical protein NC651_035158 [Populus alba x Populus x berolinensis]
MKMAGCLRDVVTYTMMIHAYNAADMVDINPGLSSGPSYTHLKEGHGAPHDVLGWIEEAGIQPSNGMYCDIYILLKSGATYASIIEERVAWITENINLWKMITSDMMRNGTLIWSRKCVAAELCSC